jgi:hypothetical protein
MVVPPEQDVKLRRPEIPQKWDDKPRIFRDGMIPSPDKTPPERTCRLVQLVYNILKGIILLRDKNKQAAALSEIKQINHPLYERVRTYYDRLTPKQIAFFIGPRPKFHDDGKLAIWDHIRDNPVLMTVIRGETPEDMDPKTLTPKSRLALPRRLGGIL